MKHPELSPIQHQGTNDKRMDRSLMACCIEIFFACDASRIRFVWFAVGFFIFATSWNAFANSPTLDEPAHLQSGLSMLHHGRFHVYAVNPPATRLIGAIPGYVYGFRPIEENLAHDPASRWEFVGGRRLVAQYGEKIMFAITSGRLLLIGVMLFYLFFLHRFVRQVYGSTAANISTSLWCLSPSILGHTGLITPDVFSGLAGVSAVFSFLSWLNDRRFSSAARCGLLSGIAVLTKFTWVPVLPIAFVAIYFIHGLCSPGRRQKRHANLVKCCTVAIGLTWLVVNLGYTFEGTFSKFDDCLFVSSTLRGHLDIDDDFPVVMQYPEEQIPLNRFAGTWIGRMPLLLPKPFLQGIDIQQRDFEFHAMDPSFLYGHWRLSGWKIYYVAAGLVKEPSTYLLMGIASLVFWFSAVLKTIGRKEEAARIDLEFLRSSSAMLSPAIILFVLVSLHDNFSHHYRYLLPGYYCFFVFIGIVASRKTPSPAFRATTTWLTLLIVVSVFPGYLSFFNYPAQFVAKKEFYLSDSAIDWGQDLLRLRAWSRQRQTDDPLYVGLFAPLNPIDLGIDCRLIPAEDVDETTGCHRVNTDDLPPGLYAISTCLQQGRITHHVGESREIIRIREEFRYLAEKQPIAQVGDTIEIFLFD